MRPAQLVHRRQPQVQLGPLAQPRLRALRRRRQRRHAGTADAGFGATAPSLDGAPPRLRSSASPFWAAIAIGSDRAPWGGVKVVFVPAAAPSLAPRRAPNTREATRPL